MSKFLKCLSTMLSFQHRTSASRNARSNGLAEALVQRVNSLLKVYNKPDEDIEQVLPLIEMALRCSNHTRFHISPFEVLYGRPMCLGTIGQASQIPEFPGQQAAYYQWLQEAMTTLHAAMKENKTEVKRKDAEQYNKAHGAVQPSWREGDLVLLLDDKIQARSERVLGHRPYIGPYYVTKAVKGQEDIGTAYQLTDAETGKVYRYLVPSDRLKRYTANKRIQLRGRLRQMTVEPEVYSEESENPQAKDEQQSERQQGFEPAIKILKQRRKGTV